MNTRRMVARLAKAQQVTRAEAEGWVKAVAEELATQMVEEGWAHIPGVFRVKLPLGSTWRPRATIYKRLKWRIEKRWKA